MVLLSRFSKKAFAERLQTGVFTPFLAPSTNGGVKITLDIIFVDVSGAQLQRTFIFAKFSLTLLQYTRFFFKKNLEFCTDFLLSGLSFLKLPRGISVIFICYKHLQQFFLSYRRVILLGQVRKWKITSFSSLKPRKKESGELVHSRPRP